MTFPSPGIDLMIRNHRQFSITPLSLDQENKTNGEGRKRERIVPFPILYTRSLTDIKRLDREEMFQKEEEEKNKRRSRNGNQSGKLRINVPRRVTASSPERLSSF